jgi:RNA polymerase subunit RPABC4/transcription elongation factor Spt4
MDGEVCPKCAATDTVFGWIKAEAIAPGFQPAHTCKPHEVLQVKGYWACRKCGLLWGHVEPDQLAKYLETSCLKN